MLPPLRGQRPPTGSPGSATEYGTLLRLKWSGEIDFSFVNLTRVTDHRSTVLELL